MNTEKTNVTVTMSTTATTLRELVEENRFEGQRLSREQIGKDDYNHLSKLYRNALDSLTDWARADYMHLSTKQDEDKCFNAMKAVLALFATDENRIIIDEASMRTIRDLATQPKRLYSKAYTDAKKAEKSAKKVMDDNYEILVKLGCTMPANEQPLDEWKAQALAENKYILDGTINMLDMYLNSIAIHTQRVKDVDDVKKAGQWTWRRPMPVNENVFADLVENYIGDCLADDYNIKTSKAIRDEKTEQRKAKAQAKA